MSSASPSRDPAAATVGAVLAGGRSERMGAPKAALALAGSPLISYPIASVAAAGLEPIVVAKKETDLPDLECRIVHEREPRSHPASGIAAALAAAGGPVVVVACDLPFVPAQLLGVLSRLDASVAVTMLGGRLQPLLARYAPGVAPQLERAVERDEPMRQVVESLDPLILGPDELAGFGDPEWIGFNVNDRGDLAAAERLMTPAHTR